MNRKILLVDDDRKTVDLIKLYLDKDGYRVLVAYDGQDAVQLARQRRPDLIILDLMLPGIDGLDVCRILRSESRVPIIMLTAKTTEEDKLFGLDLGADDYVTKPFSPRELVLRVGAILRRGRAPSADSSAESFGGGLLVIDETLRRVTIDGRLVELTPTEWGVLLALAAQPGRVCSRYELINRVRGYEFDGYERTVDSHVKNLRRKIEPDPTQPTVVQTVTGVGYRLGLSRDR